MDNFEFTALDECIIFGAMMDDKTIVGFHCRKMERSEPVEEIEENEFPNDFEWSASNEWILFEAMIDYRPLGRKKHTEMAGIVERFRQNNINISAETIWAHLRTMYNLEALDEIEDACSDEESNSEYGRREMTKEENSEKKNGKYIKRIENTDTTKITNTKGPKEEKKATGKKDNPRRDNKDGKDAKRTVTQKKQIKKEVVGKPKPMKTRSSVAKKEEKKNRKPNREEEALKRGSKRPAKLEYGARKVKKIEKQEDKNGKSIKIIENKDTTKLTNTKDPKEEKKATGKKDTPQRDRRGGKPAKHTVTVKKQNKKEVLEKLKPMKTRSSVAKKEEEKKRTPNQAEEALKSAAKRPARLEYGARKVKKIEKQKEKNGKSIKIIENKDTTNIINTKDPKEEKKATGKKDNGQRDRKKGKSAKRTVPVKQQIKKEVLEKPKPMKTRSSVAMKGKENIAPNRAEKTLKRAIKRPARFSSQPEEPGTSVTRKSQSPLTVSSASASKRRRL